MELDNIGPICRTCLKPCNGSFEALDDIILCNLNTIQLYLDIAITDEPIICETCTKNIEHCLNLKSKCVLAEDRIGSLKYREGFLKINLRSVFESDIASRCLIESGDYNVCRFCLDVVKRGCFANLDNDAAGTLRKYFPELDLDVVEDPVLCTTCRQALQRQFRFIESCLRIEEKILEYCDVEGMDCKGKVDLGNVTIFMSKKILSNGAYVVKTEENWTKIKREDLEIKREVNIKLEDAIEPEMEPTAQKTPHESTISKCHLCDFQTKDKYNLRRHMIIHKSGSELIMHKCTQCSFETKHRNNLRTHMVVHKGVAEVTMHSCADCDFKTKRRETLRKHALIHKSKAEVTMHRCPECDFETRYKNWLSKHILIHKSLSEVPTYKCEVCSFQTKYKKYLAMHTLVHKSADEAIMSKCRLCEYQTKYKYHLGAHMLTHKRVSEVVMYRCADCDYETKYKEYLHKHMVVHKSSCEVTMHKCTECDFETKRRYSLSKHGGA